MFENDNAIQNINLENDQPQKILTNIENNIVLVNDILENLDKPNS